jgi:proteic killer suppression protein
VIVSFKGADTQELFETGASRRFSNIAPAALRKLDQIHAAASLNDLRIPPANRLEALRGDRKGRHSIRVNDQFRVCFRWESDGAHDVEIVDYH